MTETRPWLPLSGRCPAGGHFFLQHHFEANCSGPDCELVLAGSYSRCQGDHRPHRRLGFVSQDPINRVQAIAQYQNRTLLAEAFASEDVILAGPSYSYNVSTNFSSGDWVPAPSFGLSLNLTDCDKDIDEYYSSLGTTYDTLTTVHVRQIC